MTFLSRLFSAKETRSTPQGTPSSWRLLQGDDGTDLPVTAPLAENLSGVFAAVQIISETVASLPALVYRTTPDGRLQDLDHPVARLFSGDPWEYQTAPEWFETMTAHCLLRGNAYAEIIRDGAGAPVALEPLHPDWVSVERIFQTDRVRYVVSRPDRPGTRRLLPEEVLHLKDRSDDGIIGKSRLHRARETFQTAMAVERFAGSTYRNGASLSGAVTHPDQIGPDAAKTLRESIEALYKGTHNAGRIGVFEEGMTWQALSVSPEDAQMLESRRFSVEQIARMFRIPPPVLGDLSNGSYSNVTELGRWFAGHTIRPWLVRWEKALERALFSEAQRRNHRIEFDMDELTRGDMLQRFQAYRIGREIGVYSANELRQFESLNPRKDGAADEYLSPLNMQPEQKGEPKP